MTDDELSELLDEVTVNAYDPLYANATYASVMKFARLVIATEREACAKLCDEESVYRLSREAHPWPGDTDPSIQGHKAITARKLGQAMRLRSNV